jgi:hypothetical protein
VKVFISYSHKDDRYRYQLATHLSLLRRNGTLDAWHDRRISPGEEWETVIDTKLGEAQLVIFLVSPDFLASDYCYGVEMKSVLERHDSGQVRAVPVVIRPVDWEGSPLGRLQALPRDARPVSTWRNRDEAWREVARGIRGIAEAHGRQAAAGTQATSGQVREEGVPRLLTVRETAELLRVHPETVLAWIGGGVVPFLALPTVGGAPEYRIPLHGLSDALTGTYDFLADVDALLRRGGGKDETT